MRGEELIALGVFAVVTAVILFVAPRKVEKKEFRRENYAVEKRII